MERLKPEIKSKKPDATIRFEPSEDVMSLLSASTIEGKLNAWHYKRGWTRRFIVREDRGAIEVMLRDYVIAIYLLEHHKLFRLASCLDLHWPFIRRAFREEFGEQTKIVE